MRQTIYFSKALKIWICVISTLLIIAVYPLRLFRRSVTVGETQAPRMVSQVVNDEHSVRQYFIAQYDKIGSLSVYVSSLEGGRYMAVALQKNGYSSVCSRFIDLKNETVPGYVTVPLGVALEPGETYNILLKGKLSSYYTAGVYMDADTPPGTGFYLYDQQTNTGLRLAYSLTYDLPLSKQTSLVLMGGLFLAGLLLCAAVSALFRKKTQADRLLMVGDVIFYPSTFVLAAGFITLFILNYPVRIFDKDPLEISFYAVGIVIAAVLSVYALYRLCNEEKREDSLRGKEWIAAALMGLALKYGCDYLNGTYNLAHYISVRQMIACLLLMTGVLLPLRTVLHPASLIAALVTTVFSVIWARGKWLAPEEDLAEAYNLETKLTAIIAILTVYILSALIVKTVGNRLNQNLARQEGEVRIFAGKIPLYLIYSLITGGVMIYFRNTRIWIPVLVLLYALIYMCVRENVFAGRWFIIVQNGVIIHFIGSLVYCLLHRGFQNHVFNRYGFVFATVTVTAEYMTLVSAVAAAMLLSRLRDFVSGGFIFEDSHGIRAFVRYMWRELILFGLAASYMTFTVSRLSTVSVSFLLIFLMGLQFFTRIKGQDSKTTGAEKMQDLKHGLIQLFVSAASLILSAVIVFPAAFTLQRTIPSLYAEQHLLPDIEDVDGYPFYESGLKTPPFILGKAGPDSAAYIRIRKFYHLYTSRILGTKYIFDWYRFDPLNYDEYQLQEYWSNGEELPESEKKLKREAAIKAGKETEIPEEEGNSAVDTADAYETNNTQSQSVQELANDENGASQSTSTDEAVTEESEEAQEKSDISNGRFEIFKSYLANLNMTGHPEMTNENTVGPHAHNIYLQTAFDCGIPSGILFLAWIGLTILGALIRYIKNVRGQTKAEHSRTNTYFLILSIGLGFAVAGLFDMTFMLANPTTLIFMLSIAPMFMKKYS